jgi:hypothetical protein
MVPIAVNASPGPERASGKDRKATNLEQAEAPGDGNFNERDQRR